MNIFQTSAASKCAIKSVTNLSPVIVPVKKNKKVSSIHWIYPKIVWTACS